MSDTPETNDPSDRNTRRAKRQLNVLPYGPSATSTNRTEIGWTHAAGYVGCTWNPVTGCVKVSPGCKHCYAETFAERFRGVIMPNGRPHVFHGGFDPELRPARLQQPFEWSTPRMVFVNSMSDLFGEFVSDDYLDRVFAVMRETPRHIYQILTKRAGRLLEYSGRNPWLADAKHIWLGVSVEDRKYGLPRIALLRQATAAVKFLSVEPLLESLGALDLTGVHWVILGGESGPKARPMDPAWAREVRDPCVAARVPFFFKQWGEFDEHGARRHKKHSGRSLDGRTWNEFPRGLIADSAPQHEPAREPEFRDGESRDAEPDAPRGEADGDPQDKGSGGLASYDAKAGCTERAFEPSTPTQDQYERFQFLHGHFNRKLGLGVQPAMLAFSRKAKTFGYFAAKRWRKDSEEEARVSEIALNPDCLSHEPREIAATIVHEMCHQWQHEHGVKKSRYGYHNAEWASKMEALGLMPSATGEPGGKKTGAKMSDYVIEGGPFALAFADLPAGALLPFVSGSPMVNGGPLPPKPLKPKDPSKTKYTCVACSLNAWAKPGADLMHCGEIMAVA